MFHYVTFHNLIWASVQVHFSFVLMHILNNSWRDWECTDVLQCLFYKTHEKSCCREGDDTFVLVFCVFWFKSVLFGLNWLNLMPGRNRFLATETQPCCKCFYATPATGQEHTQWD